LASLTALILYTIVLTASGAFAPGPLTFSAIIVGGRKGWKTGLSIATGHVIFELPFILVLGVLEAALLQLVKGAARIMDILAALFLLYFAYISAKPFLRGGHEFDGAGMPGSGLIDRHPLIVGTLLTGLNPYFLLWWMTAGYPIITVIMRGVVELGVLYGIHASMDYLWLTLMAGLGYAGSRLMDNKYYRGFMVGLSVFMALFGIDFLARGLLGVSILPF